MNFEPVLNPVLSRIICQLARIFGIEHSPDARERETFGEHRWNFDLSLTHVDKEICNAPTLRGVPNRTFSPSDSGSKISEYYQNLLIYLEAVGSCSVDIRCRVNYFDRIVSSMKTG